MEQKVIVVSARDREERFALTQAIQFRSDRFNVFPVDTPEEVLRSAVAVSAAAVVVPYEGREEMGYLLDIKRLIPGTAVIVTSGEGVVSEMLNAGADAMIPHTRAFIEDVVVKLDELVPEEDEDY